MANWQCKIPGIRAVAAIAALGVVLVSSPPPDYGRVQAQMPDPCDGVVGRWDWFVDNRPATPEVTIRLDRTMVHGDRTGKWFCAENRFVLSWDKGPTDMLSLSMDGGRLSGKNNAGASVSGDKIASIVQRPDESIFGDPRPKQFTERPPAQTPAPPPAATPPPSKQPASPAARSKVLGMDLAPLTDELRKRFHISATVTGSVVVLGVDFGSPIRPGDVILRVADEAVSRVDEIQAIVARLRADGRRAASILFANTSGDVRYVAMDIPAAAVPTPPPSSPPSAAAKPGSTGDPVLDELMKDFFPPRPGQPPSSAPPTRSRVLGLDLAPLTHELRKKFQISNTVSAGLVVLGGDADLLTSDSRTSRLSPGDVIVEFANDLVSKVDEIQARVERFRADGRRVILMMVADANGDLRFVAMDISSAAAPTPPPPSTPGQPPAAAPSPAPSPPAQAGAWTTGWSRMEVTATLKAPGGDTKKARSASASAGPSNLPRSCCRR